ncbi:hypothetical protein NHX12_025369 [Muraenolepis orangiensis]|uniref:PHD-type domain-containing protein n=1 Tax=Muraenolepis orangiensis TaxID=630683 RepID=A0A9Q0IS73_9TELE|nr:hypothetical protein NHX12_025369 [Muraenolepis orangiensis]
MDDLQPQDPWYPDTGQNGRTGLPPVDAAASSDIARSGDGIGSDDADFSDTTVTLSYVRRSDVFSSSSQDAVSARSIGKFSLRSSCESENGEAGYYLQHADGPLDLATRTQLFQALARVGDESGLCPVQPGLSNHALNGVPDDTDDSGLSSENGGQRHKPQLSGRPRPGESSSGTREALLVAGALPSSVLEDDGSASATPSDRASPTPLDQASATPSDRASPTPPDQASPTPSDRASPTPPDRRASPTPLERASPTPLDRASPTPLERASPTPLERASVPSRPGDTGIPIEPFPPGPAESSGDCRPGSDVATEPPAATSGGTKVAAARPTEEGRTGRGEFPKEVSDGEPLKHVNANPPAKTMLVGNSPPRRKLPERLGRGTRLVAMVLNLCPSAYKVKDGLGAAKTPPKAGKAPPKAGTTPPKAGKAPPKAGTTPPKAGKTPPKAGTTPPKAGTTPPKAGTTPPKAGKTPSKAGKTPSKAAKKTKSPAPCSPWKEERFVGGQKEAPAAMKTKAASRAKAGRNERLIPDYCKDCTSDGNLLNNPKNLPHNGPSSHGVASGFSPQGKGGSPASPRGRHTTPQGMTLEPGEIAFPYPPPGAEVQTPTESPKKRPAANKGSGVSPTKAARPPKRRRCKNSPGGLPFSPPEPEIRLKYVDYKEERRDPRADSFSPLEDGPRKGSSGSFPTGATPGTSCLRPGRVSVHGREPRPLVCCLCGASANAVGLGDLHGPYYPDGYRLTAKTKKAAASGPKTRGGAVCLQKEASGSPAPKRARMLCGVPPAVAEGEEVDWYSAPAVPQEPCEYWLHEDCGVWAAGVFLVKGKLYGLEEAIRVAKATVCSGCRSLGATLGCLSKGCPSKYHYRCAAKADCALVEENFSMKCKKHKNKTLKAPGGRRPEDS